MHPSEQILALAHVKHVLRRMSAVPDPITSYRLGNLSSALKGMPGASTLPVVVRLGSLAPSLPCQTVGPNFASVMPALLIMPLVF